MTPVLLIILSIWTVSTSTSDHQNIITAEPAKEIIVFTSDAGATWQNADAGLPDKVMPLSFYVAQEDMYLGTASGLYTSPAVLPQHWYKSNLEQQQITGIFPSDHGFYVTVQWNGFYEFVQDAGLWRPMHLSLPDKEIYTLLETHKGILLVSCTSGLYISGDHGRSWQKTKIKGPVTRIMESNEILIACTGQGVWRSADEGHHWDHVMLSPGYTFFIQAIDGGFIAIAQGQEFAGVQGPNELYHSSDQGMTWNPLFQQIPEGLKDVYEFNQLGKFWFACSKSGFYRSADKGVTWKNIRHLPKGETGFYKLERSGDILFALRIEGC